MILIYCVRYWYHELGYEKLVRKVCIYYAKWYFMLKVGTDAPSVLSFSGSLTMVISSQSEIGEHVVSMWYGVRCEWTNQNSEQWRNI